MSNSKIALGLAAFGFSVAGSHFDREATREAASFCASVAVGDAEAALATWATVKLVAWPPSAGSVRYQAWFSGVLANASTCEIIANDGVVTSKFVEEHRW